MVMDLLIYQGVQVSRGVALAKIRKTLQADALGTIKQHLNNQIH